MRMILLLASATSLALGTPALAQGKGNGGGNGGGGKEHAQGHAMKGPGKADGGSQRGPDRGQDRGPAQKAEAKAGKDRTDGAGSPGQRAMAKGPDRNDDRSFGGKEADRKSDGERGIERVAGRDDRGPASGDVRVKVSKGRDEWRDTSRLFVDRTWDGKRYRYDDRSFLVPTSSWCPPGLARKGNGCQPPGQARKLDRYDGWSSWYPVRYRDDGYDWRTSNGYLYRIGSRGLIASLIPLVGGALFGGQVWPEQYTGYEAPAYYDRYYGYGDSYDYRIAQNAIFAVDPASGQIDSIAGLLTGDRWSVGQRIPAGYDVYNVPLDYRDRYVDRSDAYYRYSDGYVYEVDPTTQLVRAVIELLV